MTRSPEVLVVGGTGNTGAAVAKALTAADVPVRVTTRDPDRARSLPALAGVEVAGGDSSAPETLVDALTGVAKVYYVPPTHPGWDATQTAFIEMAADAGVRHFVKMSALGASADEPSMSLRFHRKGERDLEDSGMAYTFIRPNSFFQNSLFDVASIQAENRFYSCVGDARFAKVDTRDIGDVVARVLREDGHEGRTYELTGPEPLTYDDMAGHLAAALGRPVEYVDMPAEDYERFLASAGYPEWMAAEFADIYGRGFYRASGGGYVTGTVEDFLDRPPRSYAEFAREHAAAFEPSRSTG